MSHTKRHLFSALAVVATTAALTAAVAGATTFRARGAGELRDLQLATAQPFDHATAQVVAVEDGGSTTVTLKVQGIDHSAAGATFGSHVHRGACQVGAAGVASTSTHYKHGDQAVVASRSNEVWLDFTVQPNGTASWSETVGFAIPVGAALSVVIHQDPTAVGGTAGTKLACLPVEF